MSDSSSNFKRYLVIGGSSGIGYEVARQLLEAGHAVTCASRTGLGPEGVTRWQYNLEDPIIIHDGEKMCEMGLLLPEFDGIVISGGMGAFYGPHQTRLNTIIHIAAINMVGPLWLMNRAILGWREAHKQGVVVAVTSTAGDSDAHGLGLYAACKKGVEGFITAESYHQWRKGVRLCAASLGWVQSPMTEALKPHIREAAEQRCPGGKFATAEDAAEFICHLLTTRAPAYGVFRFHAPR